MQLTGESSLHTTSTSPQINFTKIRRLLSISDSESDSENSFVDCSASDLDPTLPLTSGSGNTKETNMAPTMAQLERRMEAMFNSWKASLLEEIKDTVKGSLDEGLQDIEQRVITLEGKCLGFEEDLKEKEEKG